MGEDMKNERASEIGTRLKRLRSDRAVTQDGLAKAAGVSRGVVINLERGQSVPRAMNIRKIAGALGVSPAEIMADLPSEEWTADSLGTSTGTPSGTVRAAASPRGGEVYPHDTTAEVPDDITEDIERLHTVPFDRLLIGGDDGLSGDLRAAKRRVAAYYAENPYDAPEPVTPETGALAGEGTVASEVERQRDGILAT